MRVLFDNGTPRGLAALLTGHTVEEARLHGWEELGNGELIEVAEKAGFEVMVTTDKNISVTSRICMPAKLPSWFWNIPNGRWLGLWPA
jgi:hypothetical protein